MESLQLIPSIPAGNAIFAVPKKGRLYEQCMKLLDGAGLNHTRVSSRSAFLVDVFALWSCCLLSAICDCAGFAAAATASSESAIHTLALTHSPSIPLLSPRSYYVVPNLYPFVM